MGILTGGPSAAEPLHVEGSGVATALMVHGLGYASWEADELRRWLAPAVQLWSADNRGTGRSPAAPDSQSIADMADDIAAAIDAIGAPLDLIAHSMGGYIAQQVAVSAPHLVRRLVLIGTSGGGARSVPVPEETLRLWTDAAGLPPREYARRTMPASFRDGWTAEHPGEFERLLAARLMHPTGADAWRAQFYACQAFLAGGVASERILAPALVLHGALDRVVPVQNGRLLAASIPAAQYREIADGGHLVHLEQPAEVAALISDFLLPDRPTRKDP